MTPRFPEIDDVDIDSAAGEYGLDRLLVRAIIQVETGGNPWLCRYEPGFKYLHFPRVYAENLGQSYETEVYQQMTSWGPMQIMGAVARELGFSKPLTQLTRAPTALEWSCKKLKTLQERWGDDETRMVASWNAGSPRKTPGGLYVNQTYVDRVWSVLRVLRGPIV